MSKIIYTKAQCLREYNKCMSAANKAASEHNANDYQIAIQRARVWAKRGAAARS